jgi:hypothetical protein
MGIAWLSREVDIRMEFSKYTPLEAKEPETDWVGVKLDV